jgi:hypothetical protein
MTQRKKESALGRGLDALIRKDIVEEDNESRAKPRTNKTNKAVKSPKADKKVNTVKKVIKKSNSKEKLDNEGSNLDPDLVDSVITEVHKNPRISLWSAKSAAVLRLLKKTKPEFSISKEASALIEDAVKEKYPELWDVFDGKKM